MFEIKGTRNSATCYASVIEAQAIEQIRRMCNYEVTDYTKIRIMPDAHAGKGCVIGTTMAIFDKIVPNIVGVDIGCGMYAVNLGKADIDLEKLDEVVHRVPSGNKVWDVRRTMFDLSELECLKFIKDMDRIGRSIGTPGGGNHFIEVDLASDGCKWLVIHSGSRNLGKQVAEHYQRMAVLYRRDDDKYASRRLLICERYKEQGRENEIADALKRLDREHEQREAVPDDLCYLTGRHMESYLHDAEVCTRFAKINREKIATFILNEMGLDVKEGFHTIHNYVGKDMIIRKGAISAREGERVLIPINMRDGSIYARGLGNREWNYSAPHGAGRVMSRTNARKSIDLEEYRKAMKDVYSTSVCEKTLDEAPMAYKSIDDIMGVIGETVEVLDVWKPIYNFKAKE